MFFGRRLQSQVSPTEIAIADLNEFQFVVPTFKGALSWPDSDLHVSPPRQYAQQGWVVYDERMVGTLRHLTIEAPSTFSPLCQPIKRLGPAVPLRFEIQSTRALPAAINQQAAFAYQFREPPLTYHSIFHRVQPRFVRIYPMGSLRSQHILSQTRQFLSEEAQFIQQNREQLKNVPFYREKFNLS
ncbi:MAG: hypothetical protein ACFBSG_09305 [Leptolyngbyaceae cyanobacterium]